MFVICAFRSDLHKIFTESLELVGKNIREAL